MGLLAWAFSGVLLSQLLRYSNQLVERYENLLGLTDN